MKIYLINYLTEDCIEEIECEDIGDKEIWGNTEMRRVIFTKEQVIKEIIE